MPLEFRATARGSRHIGVRLPPTLEAERMLLERVRRPRVHRVPPSVELEVSPVRLRHVLIVVALCLALGGFLPRALAYARLHEAATSFANYALCMVGPTGPTSLREKPEEFWRLVRRRLMAAAAESRPFEACGTLLDGLDESLTKRGFHAARAREFREYAPGSAQPGHLSLADLEVTADRLSQLARSAWPFAPADPGALVQPSRTARAAAHPMALPVPAQGRGLPNTDLGYGTARSTAEGHVLAAGGGANLVAFGSRDGGQTWTPLDPDAPAARDMAGRCSAGRSATTFQLSSEGERLRIESWQGSELQTSFPLASIDSRLSMSCDASSALALIDGQSGEPPRLVSCPHSAACRDVALPLTLSWLAAGRVELSVARIRGVSVLSIADRGIVRVISSRDNGETWTPPVVAYDGDEYPAQSQAAAPKRLLALEDRVLLYAGAERGVSYPVLASDDFGASWRGLGGGS